MTPESLLPQFTPLGEETLHQGWFLRIQRASFQAPDGTTFERDIVRHPGAVAVVPITDAGGVLLVRQYRPAVDAWLLEIPAGTCDVPDEPFAETARRELAEEVGCAAASMVPLIRMANTPGFCDEWTSIFLATELTAVEHDRHGAEEEYLEVVEVPLADFDALVDDGIIVDAQTVLGVALARRNLAG